MPSNIPMRGLRLEDELYMKLRKIAASENRSFSQEQYKVHTDEAQERVLLRPQSYIWCCQYRRS